MSANPKSPGRHAKRWRIVFLCAAIAPSLLSGCATKNDLVAQAEKTERNQPSIAETQAIAEEGFIYGLPIVMSYGLMYD